MLVQVTSSKQSRVHPNCGICLPLKTNFMYVHGCNGTYMSTAQIRRNSSEQGQPTL